MDANSSKTAEKELYEPVKECLEKAFREKFGNCYLETTANGIFSDMLKSTIRDDIIFSFLGKKASPDLTGFIHTRGSKWVFPSIEGPSIVKDFITVEIKRGKITPQDIYQTKMYGDLFRAKYALLISPELIPEEIRRLNERVFMTYRYMSGWYLYIGKCSTFKGKTGISGWIPYSPFQD